MFKWSKSYLLTHPLSGKMLFYSWFLLSILLLLSLFFRGMPVALPRLYPKLQSQPIGLPKIFIDYLFFQADQSDCTESVSIYNRFASSEERSLPNLSRLSFPTRGLGWLVNQWNPLG